MKRIKSLGLVLAFLLMSVSLVSAGGQKEKAAGAEKTTKLVWYVIGNGPQPDEEKVEAAVNAYLVGKLPATLDLICFDWGAYNNKMQTIIASGETFDICFTAVWTNNYRNNVARGAFIPLNDLISTYAPKTKALVGESFLAGSAIDGKNYAIPANKEKAHNWGFIVRKDLAEKYKFDLSKVKKLEDLEPMLKTIKENEPAMYPLEAVDGESPRFLLDWDKLIDDDIPVSLYPDNRGKKVVFELEAPETMALFKTMHKFYQAGYVRKDGAAITDFLADEKAGLIFAAAKSLKPGKDVEMTNTTGKPWVQVEITPPVMSNRETTGSLQAISVTSKNPELAMKFLELFNTDKELNNLINYGIKDAHYTKVGDNTIKAGPEVAKYNPQTGWMFGNQFLNYLYDNEDPMKWKKFEDYNAKALPLKSLGFSFDPEPVKSEIAACKSVWKEFIPTLETGTLDPAVTVPKAIEKYKAIGIDKIVAEAQKQYDAWLAKTGTKY